MTGLISKAVGAMRSLDAALFPATSVPKLSARITALLTTEKLVVADVGAAGGVDPRWRELGDAVRVVTFEPRTEPGMKDPSCRNFPICLGAAPGQRTLHITRFADSSSLYRINRERMNDFAVRDCFDVVEETNVAVDSLDHCLAVNPEWMPDFLKLDVEGAELDVLRGAEACLHQRTAALRVEVSFAERHMGAPLFGDVDAFLRSRGYALHALSRELMIRQNGLHTPLAQPQLVWGDAVYFLTRSEFLCRLRALAPERRPLALTRFVILLVAHRAVDYAVEILRATQAAALADADLTTELEAMVRKSARVGFWTLPTLLFGLALGTAIYVGAFPVPSARRQATFYLKRRAGQFFYLLWRVTARGGELNASVSDPAL